MNCIQVLSLHSGLLETKVNQIGPYEVIKKVRHPSVWFVENMSRVLSDFHVIKEGTEDFVFPVTLGSKRSPQAFLTFLIEIYNISSKLLFILFRDLRC